MEKKKPLLEITIKSVILGILLSVILAAANAYLGLFAGMTVSASIPAAVISMGVLRFFKRSSILENNIVQTAASAGESLAAGVIFTIPALVLMGYWTDFDYIAIAEMSAVGGIIGVMFTIPLRRALIIEAKLTYPEGVATAAVLKAGDEARQNKEGGKHLGMILKAGLVGGLLKLFQQGFSMWNQAAETAFGFRNAKGSRTIFGFGGDLSPALLGVGYIIGLNISILMIAGGLLSWMVVLPIYSTITGHPGPITMDIANEIWSTQIRYLGVGAMVVGGLWSIVKLVRPLINGIKASLNAHRASDRGVEMKSTEQDISIKWVIGIIAVSSIPLFLLYLDVLKSVPITLIMTAVMLVFGFLFSAVAGYMGGLVGSSNNPISGVTIATILFSSLLLLLLMGKGSPEGAAGAIIIGAVVCCAASIAGPVDDALVVRVLERAQDADDDLERLVDRHGGAVLQQLPHRVALDVLHDDEGQGGLLAHGVGHGLLAGVVHGDDRGVVEGRRRLGLAAEARVEGRVLREVGAQQLDGDGTGEPGVVADVDLGHAAASDQLPDLVAPRQHARDVVYHWSSSEECWERDDSRPSVSGPSGAVFGSSSSRAAAPARSALGRAAGSFVDETGSYPIALQVVGGHNLLNFVVVTAQPLNG